MSSRPITSYSPNFHPKPRILAVLLGLAGVFAAAWASPAMAQTPAAVTNRQYDIPPGPLDEALNRYVLQAGVVISMDAGKLRGLRTEGLRGGYGVDEGFVVLLRGTGFAASKTPAGYVLVPAALESPRAPLEKSSTAAPDSLLSEVVVTATRTERPVDEVPASVSVITSKGIAQRNLNNLQEYLRTVEGVEAGQLFSVPHASSIDIRGVGGSYSAPTSKVLLDGMNTDAIVSQVQGNGGLNFLSPWDVEQVEVVRGPASALYGPEVVGGVVNLIPKRWRSDMGGEIHASYGSHDTSRVGAAIGKAGEIGDFRISTYSARSDGFVAQRQPDTPGGMISVDLGPRNWTDKKNSFTGALRPSERQEITFAYQDFATHSLTMGGTLISISISMVKPGRLAISMNWVIRAASRQAIGKLVSIIATVSIMNISGVPLAIWAWRPRGQSPAILRNSTCRSIGTSRPITR